MEFSTETYIRPDELMMELGIKKSKYYEVAKELGIKAQKDSEGRAYLRNSQANAMRRYISGNTNGGQVAKSDSSSLTKADDSNLEQLNNRNSQDIYVEPEEPTDQFNLNKLVRSAAELKAREVAMPSLVKRAIADQMVEDDLPEDLKEKVNLAREAANPKYHPAEVADQLLSQWRISRSGN